MESLVKDVSDAGIGLGALILLAYIIVQQNKILRDFRKSLEENTNVTHALAQKIHQSIEFEKEARRVMEGCKFNVKKTYA